MAKAKICDRCGKFYTMNNKLVTVPSLGRRLMEVTVNDDAKTVDEMWALMDAGVDLCDSCSLSLKKWLEMESEEKEKENENDQT